MTSKDEIRTMLDSLNEVAGKLSALPEDILGSIDAKDNEAVENGLELIKRYNNQLSVFANCSCEITGLLKDFYGVDPEAEDSGVLQGVENDETELSRERAPEQAIESFGKSKPRTLNEHFTYTKPLGFILNGNVFRDIKTWQELYLQVLEFLHEKDPLRYAGLADSSCFVSKRGNSLFSTNADSLRTARQLPGDLFAEVNHSAMIMVRNIRGLLSYFGIAPLAMKVYLQNDQEG